MKAKCKKCGETVEVTKPREFKSCKCGAINLDYGDEFYYRVGGNPEDFDGEIEGAPKIHTGNIKIEHPHPEQTITTIRRGVVCDENAVLDSSLYYTKTDSFWSEMAGHFKAMAELCEEKSKL